MKTLVTVFFYALISLTPKTINMIEVLKTHIKNKAVDKVISLIKENPALKTKMEVPV